MANMMIPAAEISRFSWSVFRPIPSFSEGGFLTASETLYIWGNNKDRAGDTARSLFCMLSLRHRPIRRQILSQIGNDISGDLHGGGGPGVAGGKLGVHPRGVVHKVGVKPGGPDLILTEVAGELMD